MGSRVVVLGSCGGWPEPGRACSGFLVEHAGTRIVIDLGYGTLARLLGVLGSSCADTLDAVVITHAHADHLVDLHGLYRARYFGARERAPIPLYAPSGVMEMLVALEGGQEDALHEVFEVHTLPAEAARIGPFLLRTQDLPHYVPNVGIRLEAHGLVIAYTGDTGQDPGLVDLGRDADLYIVDATDRHQQPAVPAATVELNLTATQAGIVGAAARARRLMLTHFWPGNDRRASAAAAAEAFQGPILLADEGLEVPLSGRRGVPAGTPRERQ